MISKRKIIVSVVVIIIATGTLLYSNRVKVKDIFLNLKSNSVPEAVTYGQAKKRMMLVDGSVETIEIIPLEADLTLPEKNSKALDSPSPQKEEELAIPEEFNLDVPFTPQAPNAVWDEIHQDACEEASALMAAFFVLERPILGPSDTDKELLKIVDWQKRYFGFWKDTDASQTADILREYYGLKNIEVQYDITIEDIKREIAQGHPVIIPAAGRELGNQYYTPPGPYYHMLVVKGYTKNRIITNDPGTKRGENFSYKNDIFYNAIHDWNSGDIAGGKKAMIVVKK
ncbi:C39 family peptidase [Patescibacteria group bacterium]